MNSLKPDEFPLQVLLGVRVGLLLLAGFCFLIWSLPFWPRLSLRGNLGNVGLLAWQLWLGFGLATLIGPWVKQRMANYAVSPRGIARFQQQQVQEFTPWSEVARVDWIRGEKRNVQWLVLTTQRGTEYKIPANFYDVKPLLKTIRERVDASRLSQSARTACGP